MLSKVGLACLSAMLVAIGSSNGAVGQTPSASGSAATNEFRQPVPAIRAEAADPPLTFVDSFKHGLLGGITKVFITPDGKRCLSDASVEITTWVQAAGKPPLITGRDETLRVNVCRCDSSTGRLGRPDWFQHKTIARETCMALFADGRYLVAVSKRKPQFMTLHIPLPTVVSDADPSRARQVPHVAGFTAVALAPDGQHAYFASFDLSSTGDKPAPVRVGAIQIFVRQGDDPLQPCATFRGEHNCVEGVASLYCTPDGHRLVACCPRKNRIVVCDREPKTGLLKLRQVITNGTDAIRCIAGINHVDASRDGQFLYTVAGYETGTGAVGVFRIQPSGDVSFVQQILNGEPGLEHFLGGHSIAVSPDGRRVYATATFAGRIGCFDRDPATGRLHARGSVEHLQPGQRISGPMGLAVHPNSRFVYVACNLDGSIAIFRSR
jgi:WD40 repeat protein